MKNNLKDSLRFIRYLASIYGVIRFEFDETPYGKEFYWVSNIHESDSLKKLKEVLFKFDEEYHEEYELERGSSREYILKIENNTLIGDINYKWDYSYLGSKWEDGNLIELIIDEIHNTLSNQIGLPKIEFLEKYYYEIEFSTEINEEDKFLLADFKNEDNVKIPLLKWTSLKDSIIKLSNNHGANTSERDCHFNYILNDEYHEVIESWKETVEFKKLKNDNVTYQI